MCIKLILFYKLRCFTYITSTEKSRNWMCKIWLFYCDDRYRWNNVKDDFQSVMRSFSPLMFLNILRSRWMECELMLFNTNHIPYRWGLPNSFSTDSLIFIWFLSSNMRKNEAKTFASIRAVVFKLWIYFPKRWHFVIFHMKETKKTQTNSRRCRVRTGNWYHVWPFSWT